MHAGAGNGPHLRFLLAGFLLFLTTICAQASMITYSDGDFVSGWEFQFIIAPGDDGFVDPRSSGFIGRFSFMGINSLGHTHMVADDDRVFSIAMNRNVVYDPGQQGAIDTLDFSLDVQHCCDSGEVGVWFVVEQDGVLFHGPLGVATGAAYDTLTMPGLSVMDLIDVQTWLTNADTGAMPDFSAGGSAITFGYAMSNTIADGDGFIDVEHRADNWLVTVNPVPVPASLPLMLSALIGGGWLARRQSHVPDDSSRRQAERLRVSIYDAF